ncbi:unnamed protein product [Rotaria sordida]|uniref:GTP-eEF1A C-terminal domain-containing protein n=1 Tax=Rotaria sordida TaxID=392033 RepID=A0A819DXD2_9BILA|nr:unnamed protein product [Rotaria sordida]
MEKKLNHEIRSLQLEIDSLDVEDPKVIKQDHVAKARFESTQTGRLICIEQLQYFPQFDRFTLHDGDHIVVIGKVLEVIE